MKAVLRYFSTKNSLKNLDIKNSIEKLNDKLKVDQSKNKDSKVYITKMSPDRIDKIGSHTLLDKQWADKPIGVIRNPHKLTEVELYKTLEKIVELPEKRLRSMLTMGNNAVDEVFLANVITRIPQFLTATLVNITKTLTLQKDYFKDHIIWRALEKELFKRRNNLNNEQLASVVHAFGITGNGTKEFYYDLEETIIDSPIPIETECLEKILQGYSQIDQGTAVLYSSIVEKILKRGLDQISVERGVDIARNLKKATNVAAAAFGYFEALEKYIHTELHQGRVQFTQLCSVSENILANNIGSNEFQLEIENFLLKTYSAENLQIITDLWKGLSTYKLKNSDLEKQLFQTLHLHKDDFTLKQLETLIWSLARYVKTQDKILLEPYQHVISEIIDRVKAKTASMKPRGVAFAIESIANLEHKNEESYKRLERVVLSKIDEFIPHYLVKILQAFYKMGYGSGELYDKVINGIIQALTSDNEGLKYSDMIRFFEIFPEVSYIYENTMSQELYMVFVNKIQQAMKDKKFPTEDVCKVFNILVRISPYQPEKDTQQLKFIAELIGRMRHSIYDIPKDYFSLTLSNLLEYQQPEIAGKFVFILQEVAKQGKLLQEFSTINDKIRLFWSLMQIEKACQDPLLVNQENLSFIQDVNLAELDPHHFMLYKQLVCLAKMWFDSQQQDLIDFDRIYEKFSSSISSERREQLVNEDPATKSNQGTVSEIARILKQSHSFAEVNQNLSDDLMNLIDVACATKSEPTQLFGILLMNKHCYLQTPFSNSDEPLVRRSVELKQDLLEQLFGWLLHPIDEQHFSSLPSSDSKEQFLFERLGLISSPQLQSQQPSPTQSGGRKVKQEEAKKKARDDIRFLLKQSGGRFNCKTLQHMREENERKKDEVDRELIFNIEKKVQEISKGVQMLSEKEEVTKDIRLKIGNIKDIWKNSCGRFSDISEDVDKLLQSKRHVEQVLGMLQNFIDMESKVEELNNKVTDEDEIFSVYKKIKIMNFMRTSFLQKIENSQAKEGNAAMATKLQRIREHFRTVKELERNFQESVIQGNLQNVHNIAKQNPSLLVKVLRVIENEEITNQSIKYKYNQQEEDDKKRQKFEMLGRGSELHDNDDVEFHKIKKNDHIPSSMEKEDEVSLKDKSLNVLQIAIRRRTLEFFQAEVEGAKNTQSGRFLALLQKAETLVGDLKYIKATVEPCFPPSYKIFEMHLAQYKKEVQDRFDAVLKTPLMEKILEEDPEAILFFSGCLQQCLQVLQELNCQDDFIMNIQISLEEFYPRFMDHAEGEFFKRLQSIHEERKTQEDDKIESFTKGKKKKLTYDTTFSTDLFDFLNTQLDAIKESLKGEKLLEFLKRMMEQLVSLIELIVQESMEHESRNPRALVQLVIRLNDLTKVASEFVKFKEQAITIIGEALSERVDNVLDEFFRQLIENANIQAEIIALFIVRSEIEQDFFLHFFTLDWKENHEIVLREVLKCASGYMSDVFKIVQEDRFSGKIAETLYSMLVDAYIERFIIAVNMRYKLKLPLEKPLLCYIYADSLLKKTDKNKLILKKHLIDFYSKTVDQELFEVMQQDMKHFQEFREAYREEIMQNRFNKKIQLLSLTSLMVNSQDEDEFAQYEEQLWVLILTSQANDDDAARKIPIGPGGIHIDGNTLVRICRKIKTKNATQKGFFKKTKQREKELQKNKKNKQSKKHS